MKEKQAQYPHRRNRMIRSLVSHRGSLRAGLLCFGALCAFSSIASAQFLGLGIFGPSTINAGANITYIITLTNNSGEAASGAQMFDTLPGTMTFFSLDAVGFSCTTPSVGASGTINCTGGTVPALSMVTIELVANVPVGTASGTMFT